MRYSRSEPPLETVEQGLNRYGVPGLKRLAAVLEHKLPTRKADLIRVLTPLMRGRALQDTWNRLSDLAKQAVAEVVHSESNRLDTTRFGAKYGGLPSLQLNDSHYRASDGAGSQSMLPLFLYGGEMPSALKAELASFVPRPEEPEVKTLEQLPEGVPIGVPSWHKKSQGDPDPMTSPIVQEATRAALHDVVAVLRLVDAGKVSVSEKTRRVTLGSASAIHEVLACGDFLPAEKITSAGETMRPFAWPLLVQAGKLVQRTGTKLKLKSGGKKALSAPAHEVIKDLFEGWLATDLLDEFNRIDSIKGQTGKGKRGLSDPADRREAIVAALAECPVGRWIEIDELGRYLRAAGHDFRVTSDPWRLYIGELQYGSLGYAGCHEWELLEGRYLRCFLWEYLATLGMLDVAYTPPEEGPCDYCDLWGTDDLEYLSRYDGLRYVRINALGAYCLELAETFEPPPREVRSALTVTPNLEIAVLGEAELQPSDLLFLSRFAEQVSDRLWRLTQQSVLTAVEEGLDLAEMAEFLLALGGGELPETVQRFFHDLQGRVGQLAYRGPAHLIEAKDSVLAKLVAHDTRLRNLCLAAGDKYLVVPAENEAAFRRGLKEIGYVWGASAKG